ncbi:MAG: hypothetical protein V4713_12185 [Pseudomonadota bacterium]
MAKFKKIAPEEKRGERIPVMVNVAEKDQITLLAKIRDLSVSDYCRRTALQRRADVTFDTQAILTLIDLTREIRQLHATFKEAGIAPPEESMLGLILDARAAMLRIAK